MKRVALALLLLVGVAVAVQAGAGKLFGNARFGYFISIPAEFSVADPEPENGDGREFHTPDKSGDLAVFGSFLTDGDFATEIKTRVGYETQDGWNVTYQSAASSKAASYSGSKGERIFYARVIPSCDGDAIASYRLEYPFAQKAHYEAAIKALNATLRAGKGSCG